MKKTLAVMLALAMLLSAASCSQKSSKSALSTSSVTETTTDVQVNDDELKYNKYASMTTEEIVAALSLEQKADQMVQPAIYNVTEDDMRTHDYGSILSTMGCIDAPSWRKTVDGFQKAALESEAGIPYIYGQDDVHGVNYCLNAVYFPHNIGQGAANDEELAYKVGLITADEAKLCHMMWNFSPCVAQSVDPRWGRTYESYGADLDTITKLSTAYTKGLIDGGLVACTKHFFADGNVLYGTGEQGNIKMLIDRGDAQLTDEEIDELLKVYQAQIDSGVQTIMISHSSLNGVKMHENKEYIMKLKDEMGFEGFIVSDWGSIQNITGASYKEQVIKSVNAGIDMLMETDRFEEAKQIIVDAVGSGDIAEERINNAVTRIIKVKKDAGLFDDPMLKDIQTEQKKTGSLEYRKVAEQLVEESLVLLKNENDVLPIKEGTKVYITGPAADNGQAQCGGWTIDWNSPPSKDVQGVTTILEAFERYAEDYGIEVITDEKDAEKADVVLLCVGEKAYAEWNGDTEDLELCGELGLSNNAKSIKSAKELGKPTVTCIIAGRQVILDESDYNSWDGVVMCYLPGSEGKGISDVLCGCSDFTGKLPSPWYSSLDQIRTENCWLEMGYGLSYGEGFAARTEPDTILEETSEDEVESTLADTNYTKGLFKDGVYVNDYADIKANIPAELKQLGDSEINWINNFELSLCSEEKDKLRLSADTFDYYFESNSYNISFSFLNTDLGIPDNPNYSEDDLLNDMKVFLMNDGTPTEAKFDYEDRVKVNLGSNEYLRDVCRVEVEGTKQFYYDYVRKLDDELMCIIEISGVGNFSPEEFEKMFD